MASIGNTLSFQLASLAKANQAEAGRTLSNRNTKPLEQTSSAATPSAQTSEGLAANTTLTYAHLNAQSSPKSTTQSAGNRLSSQSAALAASQAAKPPANNYAQMGAFKDLVGHYQNANARYASAADDWAGRIQQDPATGEKHFVNDGKINQAPRAKTGELFDLTLTTKDGDRIQFSISADYMASLEGDALTGASLETAFSFAVEGTLSDKEREAVNDLVTRLGNIAKDYDQRGWVDVDFLGAFNNDALADVNFNVQGNDGKALAVAYSVDAATGTHSLAVNQNDYDYVLSADMPLDLSGFALQENTLYQQLQQTLIDTNQAYKPGEFLGGVSSSKATDFFLKGLEAIFSPVGMAAGKTLVDVTGDPAATAIKPTDQAVAGQLTTQPSVNSTPADKAASAELRPIEAQFLSGLPDFTASFHTPRFTPNKSNSGEVSQMTLNMAQVTAVSVSRGAKTLDQRYSFDSQVSQHFGIGGDSMEHANLADIDTPGGQTYEYEVLKQSATLARTMTLDNNGRVASYQEDKDSEHTKTTKKVVNGFVEATQKEDLSEPQDNYSLSMQVAKSPRELAVNAIQVKGYQDVQLLKEAIKSQHINLYS